MDVRSPKRREFLLHSPTQWQWFSMDRTTTKIAPKRRGNFGGCPVHWKALSLRRRMQQKIDNGIIATAAADCVANRLAGVTLTFSPVTNPPARCGLSSKFFDRALVLLVRISCLGISVRNHHRCHHPILYYQYNLSLEGGFAQTWNVELAIRWSRVLRPVATLSVTTPGKLYPPLIPPSLSCVIWYRSKICEDHCKKQSQTANFAPGPPPGELDEMYVLPLIRAHSRHYVITWCHA